VFWLKKNCRKCKMDTKLWGPPLWFSLHTICVNYPESPSYMEKRNHYDFFKNLQYILPCETCKSHYRNNFKKYPIENFLDNKRLLVKWINLMHNAANEIIHTRQWKFEDSVKHYKDIYDDATKEKYYDYFCGSCSKRVSISTCLAEKRTLRLRLIYVSIALIVAIFMVCFLLFIIYRSTGTLPSKPEHVQQPTLPFIRTISK
jgi:hypothetical protein